MSPPVIEITVDPQGQVTVETRGYAGRSCRQGSAFLEKALGQVTREKVTAEFYQSQTARRRNTTRG